MGTAISRRTARIALAASLGAVAATGGGCGSQASHTQPAGASSGTAASGTAAAWLRTTPPPPGWPVARVPWGAQLTYPPGWRPAHGDVGTATVVLHASDGKLVGYLNLTPRQGDERLSDWPSFRTDHNREEGDRAVRRLAAATNLVFPTGRGSCVRDAYTTKTGAHYIETACFVVGSRTSAVVVGAASPTAWARQSADIDRAIVGVGV